MNAPSMCQKANYKFLSSVSKAALPLFSTQLAEQNAAKGIVVVKNV